MALFTRVQHLCSFFQMFGRRRTPSVRPSLLMFRIDLSIAWIISSLMLYRVPPSGSFILLKRSYSHWLISGENGRCFRISHCQRRKGVHDSSSGVTPCIVMKKGFCTTKCHRFLQSPWDYDLFAKIKKTAARDPVQHKRWICPCYRAVNMEHQQRCTRWWCTTPSKHLTKGDK